MVLMHLFSARIPHWWCSHLMVSYHIFGIEWINMFAFGFWAFTSLLLCSNGCQNRVTKSILPRSTKLPLPISLAAWRRDSFLAIKSLDPPYPWVPTKEDAVLPVCKCETVSLVYRTWWCLFSERIPQELGGNHHLPKTSAMKPCLVCRLRAAWLFWWVRFYVLQHLAFILEGGFRCVMLWAVELKFGGVPKLPVERPEANFSSFGRGQSIQKGHT